MRRFVAAFTWLSAIATAGVIIGYFFWPQFVKLEQLRREEKRLRIRVEIEERKNQILRAEEQKMRTSPDHIEKVAREKLGLIRSDEIIYKFEETKE